MKKYISFIILLLLFISCGNKENKNIIKFSNTLFMNDENVPSAQFNINNKKVELIIDTGSEMSIIDDDFYNNNKSQYAIVDSLITSINTINGQTEEIIVPVIKGYANDSIPITFYVMDIDNIIKQTFINKGIMINGIIGCDFLYENQVIIDFKNKTISNIGK